VKSEVCIKLVLLITKIFVQCLRTSLIFEPVSRKSLSVCAEAVWGSYEQFTVSVRTTDCKNDYLRHTIQLSIYLRKEAQFFVGI
jgi:hypothetical protein